MEQTKILKNFLNAYWIRPETAVWRTLDTMLLRKLEFIKPIIDIGCGDGLFIFTLFGLKIDKHENYATEQLVKFWSIGLRPYSPFLIEMANNLNTVTRTKIKKKIIKELSPLLDSYINYEIAKVGTKNCFHLFVLSQ